MGLVNYSDSESSEDEKNNLELKQDPIPRHSKKGFQKVVDKSNPGKIRVLLPQSSKAEEEKIIEPPFKKAKVEEGSLRGFNSLLPTPKRSAPAKIINSSGLGNTVKASIESVVNSGNGDTVRHSREHTKNNIFSMVKDVETSCSASDLGKSPPLKSNNDAAKAMMKPLMFKPLSVSNKSNKKKKIAASSVAKSSVSALALNDSVPIPENQQKISLFSITTENEEKFLSLPKGEYQPIIFNTSKTTDQASDGETSKVLDQNISSTSTELPSSSLSSVADSLHLSSSERRQLFGRQKEKSEIATATSIINFSTDMEYSHNEEIRAAGEQVVHNPVRAIAPGKHSLKQLVNAVQSQKDALEESFAKGKSNRAEASSRYGW